MVRYDYSEYPHHDPEWLHQKYWVEGLSLNQMADEAGFSLGAIAQHMEKNDIPRRGNAEAQRLRQMREPVPLIHGELGHEIWKDSTGQQAGWYEENVAVHRLAALAWGIIESWDEDCHIHHINGIPWDTREENLEALPPADHLRLHHPHL